VDLLMPKGKAAVDGIDPDAAFERAVRCLLALDFPAALGMAAGAYVDALPRPDVDRALAAEGYDRLVLVEPRVSLRTALRHPELADHLPHAPVEDVAAMDLEAPYWIQAQGGGRYRGRAVRDAVAAFGSGERGLTAAEGLALVVQYPDVLADDRGIDLPGSLARGAGVPCLAIWYGKVGVFARPDTIPSPLYGAVSTRRGAGAVTSGGQE
jgi:hypothetical protein